MGSPNGEGDVKTDKCWFNEQREMKNVPMALDLFCGTKSVPEALRGMGYHVVTLDSNPKTCPDMCVDILQWDYRSLKPGKFDVIFAAVPCTEYSMALTTRPRDLPLADAVVRRTLEVISFLRSRLWFIENPRTGLLSQSPLVCEYSRVDVDYC